jgi:pSer/pThr/pTyr-binding forkhead associated (FHA) protein
MARSAARLEVIDGKAVGMSVIVEDELVIGRQVEGAGRLADDDEISRLHARITLDAGGSCAIEDLGSTNGTYVNGTKISAPQTLSAGDTIEIGGTTLVLRELPPAEAAAPGREATRMATAQPGAAFAQMPAMAEPGVERRGEPPPAYPAAPPESVAPAYPAAPPESVARVYPAAPPEPATAALEPVAVAHPAAPPQPATGARPVASAHPAAPPPPIAPPEPPPLSLQLEVDFAAREARLSVGPNSSPIRLVFEAGAWRLNPASTNQEGGPHERSPNGA